MAAARTPPHVFPETEIVDAMNLMQEFGVPLLDVSNGERLVGIVTAVDIDLHAASAERTRLVGSIMMPRPEMLQGAGSGGRAGGALRRHESSAHDRIATAVRGWLDAPSSPAT
jgi:CBS domain-containing protein